MTVYGTPRAYMVGRTPVVPARGVTDEDHSYVQPRPDIPHHGIPSRRVHSDRMRRAGRGVIWAALAAVLTADAVLAVTLACIWR